jgi:hypothetical protein
MRERTDCTRTGGGAPAVAGEWVSIFVGDDHPVLRLQQALDWPALTAEMVSYWRAAGKNVDGRPGLAWPVGLYVPLLVLMWLKGYHARQMEEYLSESVVARRFLGLPPGARPQIRDHASIARAEAALGAAGKKAVNTLVLRTAEQLQFTSRTTLSADTTVQEPAIGYPNEPGILKGWAERIERALRQLTGKGVQGVQAGIAHAKRIYQSVKHHHLFAKTQAAKTQILHELVTTSADLTATIKGVSQQLSARSGRGQQRAKAPLETMAAVAGQLLPQIQQWLTTGKVATEKILHAGLTAARAISKGKGKVKFGMKWLINRLAGGYLFGERVAARADENQMPLAAVQQYRQVFGAQATPQRVIYDRGANLAVVVPGLKKAGVQKVGIPPRGQGTWRVGKKEQQLVKRERGKTEGSIGRLKRHKYGFSHRPERSLATQDAAGQRAIVAVNLNTLLRDVVAQAHAAR